MKLITTQTNTPYSNYDESLTSHTQ